MSKIDVKKLINNDDIKYVYLIPNSLFEDNIQYVLIGDLDTESEDSIFCYSMADWFLMIEQGNLLPFACATLNKKYKPKEFLNIYQKPDMLNFRKFILNSNLTEWEKTQQLYWMLQIINEWKINRYDAFASKNDFKALLNDFLNKVEGMYVKSFESQNKA